MDNWHLTPLCRSGQGEKDGKGTAEYKLVESVVLTCPLFKALCCSSVLTVHFSVVDLANHSSLSERYSFGERLSNTRRDRSDYSK